MEYELIIPWAWKLLSMDKDQSGLAGNPVGHVIAKYLQFETDT